MDPDARSAMFLGLRYERPDAADLQNAVALSWQSQWLLHPLHPPHQFKTL